MKKKLSLALVLIMIFSLATLTSCGEEKNPYADYNLTDYVTLPDYDSYEYSLEVAEVTDDDIEDEIESRLEESATSETITEGTVEEGDTVTISFEGKLADGTEVDGMSSDSATVVLGSGSYIDGFEESMYGAEIGDTVTANVTFPDPYDVNEDLSGKDAVFTITIQSKTVTTYPELTDEFVSSSTDYKTVEEFREGVKADLEEEAQEDAEYQLKSDIYNKILEESTVTEPIEEKVTESSDVYNEFYKSMADSYGLEWEDFLDQYFGMDEDEYNEALEDASQQVVETSMIVYALSDQEGVKIKTKDYETELSDFCTNLGYEDAETFEESTGFSLDTYAEIYGLRLNLYLEEAMTKILDRNLAEGSDAE